MKSQEFKGRVAVLGLGAMGSGMARRLLEQGFTVDVWNRTPAPAVDVAASGATAHTSAREAVATADVILTMLPNEAALNEVMSAGGVLEALPSRSIWAQMGTIGVEATERFASEVAQRRPDVTFLDAPVSGSRVPARTGKLIIFASGPDEARNAITPVFAALGERTLWLGQAGFGSRMKLAANTLLAFEIEAVAEIRAVAARLQIPYTTLVDALNGSPLASAFELLKLAKMESGDDSPDFSLEWALKDLDLVVSAAGEGAAPITAAIAKRWHELVSQGYGRLDVSAARMGLEGVKVVA